MARAGAACGSAGTGVLEYAGKPLVLPFKCTEEDIQLAGLTCSEDDPCPIYLELAAVGATGSKIVVAGNLHSAAVTMFSTLLASEDGGRTWREPHDRIRAAGLDRVQFLDADTAWVAGEKLQPLPHGSVPPADDRRRTSPGASGRFSARRRRTGWGPSSSSGSQRKTAGA